MIDVVESPAKYALIVLYTTGANTVEYFTDYPDLKLSPLVYTTPYDLYRQGITGFTLCEYTDPVWQIKHFVPYDSGASDHLRALIQSKLNSFKKVNK